MSDTVQLNGSKRLSVAKGSQDPYQIGCGSFFSSANLSKLHLDSKYF